MARTSNTSTLRTVTQPATIGDCLLVLSNLRPVTKTGINRSEVGSPAYDHVETYLNAVKWDQRLCTDDLGLLDCDLRNTTDTRSRGMRDIIHKIASER